MEGISKGKIIFSEEESPKKSLVKMDQSKLCLNGNNFSSSNKTASSVTIDLITNSAQDQAPRPNLGPNYDQNMDPRKLRRIMSNKLSAHRSRMKKVQYVTGLETQAIGFQTHIAEVEPQIILYQKMKQHLMVENQALELKMEALKEVTQIKSVEIERKQAEVTMLRKLYRMQEEEFLAHTYNHQVPNYYHPNSNQVFQVVEQNGEGNWIPGLPVIPDQNQTNMALPQMDHMMNTNLMNNNNNGWNPNFGNGFIN